MEARARGDDRRAVLDAKLTELALYAKELCPDALVEVSTVQYEDEDGHVGVFPPPGFSGAEEDRIGLQLAGRAADIFEQVGLFIACAVLERAAP